MASRGNMLTRWLGSALNKIVSGGAMWSGCKGRGGGEGIGEGSSAAAIAF